MRAPDCTHPMHKALATGPVGAGRTQPVSYTLRDILHALVLQILIWHERSRQRRDLAQLSDHMLRDIGLSRAEVWVERGKPFWRP